MTRRLKLFFDGGCRPNPGRIEAAVVIRGKAHYFDDLGIGSSQDAEWRALLEAVKMARSSGEGAFELIGDSAHVIAQANGLAKCDADALTYKQAFDAAASGLTMRVRWIRRTQNLAGIALARRGAL